MAAVILLVQSTESTASRTYVVFEAPAQAWDAVTRMCVWSALFHARALSPRSPAASPACRYEDKLKGTLPGVASITYDVQDVFRYIDNLPDLSCLVLEGKRYTPCGRDYVKAQIYAHLRKAVK